MKRLLTASLLGLAATCHAAGDIGDAMLAYEQGHYATAFKRFQTAARAGDARAQEILGFMHAFGPDMYPGVPRDPRAAVQWFDLAARNGRPVSRFMMCAMLRHADDSLPKGWHCFDWVAVTGKPAPK